jgi:ectoine hydroxylase-related dioxygenase (phytanoyl-CoA dioxygenase family)
MNTAQLDFTGLEEDGYALLPQIVSADRLAVFEQVIRKVGETECRKLGRETTRGEPLAAALSLGGEYRTTLFTRIKQLGIVHEMTSDVIVHIRDSEILTKMGIEVLSYYQTMKGDLPNDDLFALPYHQDYKLTRSHRALRIWVPLRDVNAFAGSIEFALASHRKEFEYEIGKDGYRIIPDKQIDGHFDKRIIELKAGSGVIFNPLVVHRSVPNRGARIKFALIIQIEDMEALANPFDPGDRLTALMAM